MKTLFEETFQKEIVSRLEKVTPSSQRNWGKMDVAQMMAHCSIVLETAMGKNNPPRSIPGRIMGRFFRHHYTDDHPFKLHNPTDPSFLILDKKIFDAEKERLKETIQKFIEGGHEGVTKRPHPFFGNFTSEEWASGMYKHLDHHLRQFSA